MMNMNYTNSTNALHKSTRKTQRHSSIGVHHKHAHYVSDKFPEMYNLLKVARDKHVQMHCMVGKTEHTNQLCGV